MAANLQQLKRRIKTAQNISQIAKAMEMIAASKIKRAQNAVSGNKPYAEKIIEQTQKLLASVNKEKFTHPFITEKSAGKNLFILLSPDKGLCGGLITNLLKKIVEIDSKDNQYIILGKKIERASSLLEGEVIASFPFGTRLPTYSVIYPLTKLIDQYFVNGDTASVSILYPEFKSLFTQEPTVKKLLPIVATQTSELTDSKDQNSQSMAEETTYLFEPSQSEILSSLLPYYLEVALFSSILESYTSEQAARMLAMQNAKNNARDIAAALNLSYNKSRQEKITNELLDLNNGAIA